MRYSSVCACVRACVCVCEFATKTMRRANQIFRVEGIERKMANIYNTQKAQTISVTA